VLREGVHLLGAEIRRPFSALIAVQAAHSIEEYVGRLYLSFPPARFVSGVISTDLERGFIIANACVAGFGLWCIFWPVRRNWPSAALFAWLWVAIESMNGVGHLFWSLVQRGYTPGIATAPLLLVVALMMARRLSDQTAVPAA
jgi:Protein of unknown function with HXXEE motif